jgi:hypothetical protein
MSIVAIIPIIVAIGPIIATVDPTIVAIIPTIVAEMQHTSNLFEVVKVHYRSPRETETSIPPNREYTLHLEEETQPFQSRLHNKT